MAKILGCEPGDRLKQEVIMSGLTESEPQQLPQSLFDFVRGLFGGESDFIVFWVIDWLHFEEKRVLETRKNNLL